MHFTKIWVGLAGSMLFMFSTLVYAIGSPIQTGTMDVGPQDGRQTEVTVSFSTPFAEPPVVVANALQDESTNTPIQDSFTVSIVSVSRNQFVARIYRVDEDDGWAQKLDLNWIAISR